VALAENAAGWWKLLIARVGAVINDEADVSRVPEPVAGGLMKR
jgi:hypothetical protein